MIFISRQVLRGGATEETIEGLIEDQESKIEITEAEQNLLYGKPFDLKTLGQYYDFQGTKLFEETPILDNSLAYVRI